MAQLKVFTKMLILLVCMISLFIKPGLASEVKCIERERQALLKFKQGVVDDKGLLSSWGSGEGERECCKWRGVECSNITGHVIRFDLASYFNGGKINSALLELKHLEYLDLSFNYLQADNLEWLSHLSSLRYLDLSGNALNQPLDQIFQNLSGKASKSLEHIDLSANQLVGSLSDITQFPSLRTLALAHNQLIEFRPQSPSQFSSLEILDLSDNKIGGSLPGLKAYSSLQQLNLFGNQIKGLPESIGRLSKLWYLDLSSNSLEGMITEDHLSNLENLNYLYLSNNSQLFLNMSSNWRPPFQLKELHLEHCNVGPTFPKWVRTQTSLHTLVMPFAGISGTLLSWLWDMPSLLYLDLSHNHISGRIPHPLSNVPFFEFIDLSDNHLSGPIPLFLFYSIELRLSKNKFFGSISRLCKALNHSKMRVLDLSDNKLTGELHNCWTDTSSLNVVNLANNNLSGRIPSSLGNINGLSILHLRNNSFVGELPHSLKNCIWLEMLDVGRNKLTGTIPQWIGTHLRNLTILSLRFNQFHGSIDTTICHLTHIEVLDLSRNNLSGKIPECFNSFASLLQKNISTTGHDFFGYGPPANYTFSDPYIDNILIQWKGRDSEYNKLGLLKGIDLSNNKLVGTIPQEFSDLRGLVFLNLSSNHLTGNIMSNIGQMEMLEWLDLSRNELSGVIPTSLAELHFLSVLDLSYNKLAGKIPLGTQLQSFNNSAYAGNSQLCGPPLPECPWDSPYPSSIDHGDGNNVDEEDGCINRDFYICMVFGFITGFWIVVGTLVVNHSWRQSYFNFWKKIGDWAYVTSTIYMAKFKRKFLD